MQASTASAFGQANALASNTGAFGGFASINPNTAGFGMQNQAASVDAWAGEAPTEDSLPPEILSLFKADKFEWGQVPSVEPPVSVR